MSIKTSIRNCASEVGVSSRIVWLLSRWVDMLFCQSEVDQKHHILFFWSVTHHKVRLYYVGINIIMLTYRLNVTMDKSSIMNACYSFKSLLEDVKGHELIELFAHLFLEVT
jgi:hypothetical protein